ncbi:MAG: hypothetical protein JRJ03_09240 [Deltaproteobacteria bacterium]|nr:hypothetical protein [Deltaproteobacteria bacterium]
MPGKTEKVQVAGVKLSDELLQINISGISNDLDASLLISRLMAENKINMQFLWGFSLRAHSEAKCCVSMREEARIRDLVKKDVTLRGEVEFIPSVGMLSLFPHQFNLRILGASLAAFGEAGLPLYGMSSSLSALTFITDYIHLRSAVAALRQYLSIPEGEDSASSLP